MALAPAVRRWDLLGGGKFQAKADMQRRSSAGQNRRMRAGQSRAETKNKNKISAALTKVASEHGIEAITVVALAYVMFKGANIFPVMGGRKVERLN